MSVGVCACFQQRCIFVSEPEALLYDTVLLTLPIFTQVFGGEGLFPTWFLAWLSGPRC